MFWKNVEACSYVELVLFKTQPKVFFYWKFNIYVYIFKHTLLCVHVSTRFLSNQFHSFVINAVI